MPPRHALLRLTAGGWATLIARYPAFTSDETLALWPARGWPLISRRRLADDPPDVVPLGLPLPPAQGKQRIGLTISECAIANIADPPLLAEARGGAPEAWQETISALLALAPRTRCFGSLAWQHITGLAYLGAASDLDLLWLLPAEPMALLDGIARIAATAPMRIDGEVLGRPGGVQWRELASADPVAVKGAEAITLMPRADFYRGSA